MALVAPPPVLRFECPRCRHVAEADPGTRLRCPQCGYEGDAPGADRAGPASPPHATGPVHETPWRTVPDETERWPGSAGPAPTSFAPVQPQWQHQQSQWNAGTRPPVSQGLAIAALLINILLIPGVGSLIGGRTQEGIWQLVLVLSPAIAALLTIFIIGIFLLPVTIIAAIAGWIWALVTGIQILQESNAAYHNG